jgi:hypothetical protein
MVANTQKEHRVGNGVSPVTGLAVEEWRMAPMVKALQALRGDRHSR